jgi:hypothetical protein
MLRLAPAIVLLLCGCPQPSPFDGGVPDVPDASLTWRSALYPPDWTAGRTDDAGRFLPDFSWAGWHHGEGNPGLPAFTVRVQNDGGEMTAAVQAAIDAVEAAAGGVVLLPEGRWLFGSSLRVRGSGVVLRGEGPAKTQLIFTQTTGLANSENLRFGNALRFAGEWPLASDGVERQRVVTVGASDAGALAVGDDVAVGFVITPAFVAEHQMTGTWQAFNGTWQPFFWRKIAAVGADGAVELDVPLRYPLKLRDQASVRRVEGIVREVGLESLGFTNAIAAGSAYAMDQVHVVTFTGVSDSWVRDVASFSLDGGAHVQSGGVMIHQSKNVTVERVELGLAQHRGSGGNGYLFELRQSNEVLTRDCVGANGRHNFIQNWGFGTSGCVWLRVHSSGGFSASAPGSSFGGTGYSEFHHSLATANLIDSSTFDDGFSIVNRRLESTGAGHTGTWNVMWNNSGTGVLRSMQFGWGYVIGTRGLELAFDSPLGADEFTAPRDWLEGVDAGATLEPASLYEDQLRRRLGGK